MTKRAHFLVSLLFGPLAFAQLQITTTSVPTATQYQSYSTALQASGGTQPYTWSVVSSTGVSLPEGMSLNPSTGVVSAAQVAGQGGYSVTIQVSDSSSPSPNTATATLNFGVNSDTSFAGCEMFPPDSIYNQRIDSLPVDTNSGHQIPSAYLSSPLHPDFGHGFYPGPGGIPWMRVPANQPPTNVNLAGSGQIDAAGTYSWPFPPYPNAPIEGTTYGQAGNDHHILILQTSVNNVTGPQTGACTLYETYQSTAVQSMFDASTNTYLLGAGVHYVLTSDEIAASESTLDNGAQDSAGIPMVPLLMRYSDVPLAVQHPLRITFPSPTDEWVWPGTGCCGGSGPPQGLLYRLKASVNWQATCPASTNPQAATVLQALQQYGAYMSDHGSAGYVSGVPDINWNDDDLGCIKNFTVSDLEVVDNSALEVSAISGQTKPYVVPLTLAGGTVGASYSAALASVGGNPATIQWSVSSGSLPPGLLLDASTGQISGQPTSSSGSPFSFGITATDTNSGFSSQAQTFSIAVAGGAPTTTAVTITSSPVGRSITVDGVAYTTPQTFNWASGASHTLNAPSPQGTGTQYVFSSWSNGGAESQTITVPASAVTYTASFATQYLLTTNVAPAGGGTVSVSPTSASGYYPAGTSVQISAVPAAGYSFSGFSGGLTGTATPQQLTVTGPLSVTANFAGQVKLGITLTNSAAFSRGEKDATFKISVTNTSSVATNGAVTVTESLPAGMTMVSMSGSGWSCTGDACTRSNSLAAGKSYAEITVTVDISSSASSPLVDSSTVSGGGAPSATATDSVTVRK